MEKILKKIFKTFETSYKGMIVFKDISFYSLCEHHFLPIIGTVDIGIVPSKQTNKVIGFNKIPRLVNVFAHRLQIQENLTSQITDCINDLIKPEGVMVVTKARHLCAEMRSIKHQNHNVICSDYRGCFLENNYQAEFFSYRNIEKI